MIMICQRRLINCNKYTTLVDTGEAMHVRGQRKHGKSLLSSQFCCEPKTALKNKVLLKNQLYFNILAINLEVKLRKQSHSQCHFIHNSIKETKDAFN